VSEELVLALARAPNDQALWGRLYDKLRPGVYYAAYRACRGATELARDLVQGAFERLLRYGDLESFETDAQLAAYLRAIVWRLALAEMRRVAVTAPLEPGDQEQLASPFGATDSDAEFAAADLKSLAEGLSDEDQALLGQLVVGRTLTEIADSAGVSYSAAAVRVHRLKDKLREKTITWRMPGKNSPG
jgi:RNA polymerase sigma factor (sigma-70 family)